MSASSDQLPQGWRCVRFDDIVRRIERKIELDDTASYDCAGVRWYGMGAFKRETLLGMQIKRKQQWILRQGDVVYNKLFAWKGAFAIADASVDGCIVSDKFPTYAIDSTLVDAKYLGYFFRTPQLAQQAMGFSKGAAAISKLTLNPPQFWDLTMPLPPLLEQRRIVARIEELAARIEEARGLRREAMAEAEALWNSELEGAFRIGNVVRIHDISQFVTKGATPTTYGHEWQDSGVLFLRSQCVRVGFVTLEGSLRITPGADEMLARSRVQPRDVLYNITGASIGRCAMFPPELGAANINQHIALIRLSDQALPEYVVYALNNPLVLRHSLSIQAGGAQPLLSLSQVKAIKIALPSMSEQQHIVAHLDHFQAGVNALKRVQAESEAELGALLPSVLDQAFRGEM